jgi:hypothetical protein
VGPLDTELDTAALRELTQRFQALYDFPSAPCERLLQHGFTRRREVVRVGDQDTRFAVDDLVLDPADPVGTSPRGRGAGD